LTAQRKSKEAIFTEAARGTECYRAPEILCDHKVTEASDLWSLGCILFELYCGRRVFFHDREVWAYHEGTVPQPSVKFELVRNHRLDAYVSELVSNLLERDGRNRPSAKDLRYVLKNLSDGRDEVYMISSESLGSYILCDARSVDDPVWKSLKWKRCWYIFKFTPLNSIAKVATLLSQTVEQVQHLLPSLFATAKIANVARWNGHRNGNGYL
jgi:serine/threonine protein kinase